MRELGAETIKVNGISVDFRRPVPWATQANAERVEVTSSGERVEVHEPIPDAGPPDEFEQWYNSQPVPSFKR